MRLDNLLSLLEQWALTVPWRAWARRHPVTLHFSEYLPEGVGYLMQGYDAEGRPDTRRVTVITRVGAFEAVRRAYPSRFPPTDQELAEMIAYIHAEMPEPGD